MLKSSTIYVGQAGFSFADLRFRVPWFKSSKVQRFKIQFAKGKGQLAKKKFKGSKVQLAKGKGQLANRQS
jgi:hypothetical protein